MNLAAKTRFWPVLSTLLALGHADLDGMWPRVGQSTPERSKTLERGFLCSPIAQSIIWGRLSVTANIPFGASSLTWTHSFRTREEWYEAIPEDSRPRKEQPFYHLLAENDQSFYVAYVSEQNLVADYSGEPVDHPDIPDLFGAFEDGSYELHFQLN